MNEFLFIITIFLSLAYVLASFKYGKTALYIAFATLYITCNIVSGKIINIFGVEISSSNVFYAALFLGTDLLSEHFGTKSARKAIYYSLFALISFIVFTTIVKYISSSEQTIFFSNSYSVVFSTALRISLASLITFTITNLFDIWWYEKIKSKFSQRKHLWIRNNGSTIVSQLLDCLIFFPLAFYGTIPTYVLMEIAFSGYLIKVFVAILDTPFIYLSHYIKPNELK